MTCMCCSEHIDDDAQEFDVCLGLDVPFCIQCWQDTDRCWESLRGGKEYLSLLAMHDNLEEMLAKCPETLAERDARESREYVERTPSYFPDAFEIMTFMENF